MKAKHREILDLLEEYLSQEGAEHLRFTQALYNLNIYSQVEIGGSFFLVDNYNDLDSWVIQRIKTVMEK
jgi:hypothetical protein